MNNLKRILSLALATVMVIGMMVVGASAAEFADGDKINADYANAVETMNALGIINGFEDDTFRPEDTLTRAQMAMMLATIYRNGRTDFKFAVKDTPSFKDVKSTDWYAGAIEYATNAKIINGRGNGIFDPQSTVTGIEAARMILNAMGYEQGEGDWQLNTVLQAEEVGIYDGVDEDDQIADKLTRQAAAQMLYNGTVKCPTADSETVTETYYELTYTLNNDTTVYTCAVEFESSTSAYLFASLSHMNVAGVEKKTKNVKTTLAIEYLDLATVTGIVSKVEKEDKKTTYAVTVGAKTFKGIAADYTDLLGRNATVMFKGANNAVYAINAIDKVVATIDGIDYDAVQKSDANPTGYEIEASPVYWVNGANAASATIGAGSIVELINNDSDAKIDTIRVINKAVAVLSADPKVETKNDKTTVTINSVKYNSNAVKGYEELKKGDTVLYVTVNGVTTFEKAEKVTGKITAIGPNTGKYYTVNGEKLYESQLSGATTLATPDFKTEYDFYLDNYKNVIKMALAGDAPAAELYAVTMDFGYVGSNTAAGATDNTTYQVQLLFPDGSSSVVELVSYTTNAATPVTYTKANLNTGINTLDTDNTYHIVSYTEKDGKFTLKEVGTALTGNITGGKAQFASSALGNSATIFLVKVTGGDADPSNDKLTVYTGVNNLPSADNASGQTFKASGDFETLVYLEVAALKGTTTLETAYFIGNDAYVVTAEGYAVQAIVDGEVKTLVVDEDNWTTGNNVKAATGLKKVTYTDGKVTKAEALAPGDGFVSANNVTMASEFVKADATYYNVAENAVIFKLGANGSATLVAPADLADALAEMEDAHYAAQILHGTTAADANTIVAMYITVVAD